MEKFELKGQIVDVHQRLIFPGSIQIEHGRIARIDALEAAPPVYILPGLVDAHVHIESSMLVPTRFAEMVVRYGTVATVSDPHEIANVLGIPGIEYMVHDGRKLPFRFFFGVPSCVPATDFETSGARISASDVKQLLDNPDFLYLSEMMNYPGVVFDDPEVTAKLDAARQTGKPIDGHIPGISGDWLRKYVAAGITTDHECSTLAEAVEKIALGMKILIREGSAARNFEALYPLIDSHPQSVMLCSDDAHPDDLLTGHINRLIDRGTEKGLDFFNLLRAATINPIRHYGLDLGCLRVGDPADLILCSSIKPLQPIETYIRGEKVFAGGQCLWSYSPQKPLNHFHASPLNPEDIALKTRAGMQIRVIDAIDGELLTRSFLWSPEPGRATIEPDTRQDILKIVLLNRYTPAPPVIGFIRGFGLKAGALASSIAHDSHNLLAIGVDDQSICQAMNRVISNQGGIAVVTGRETHDLPLPVAGIMSQMPGDELAGIYQQINQAVKSMGSSLSAPLMTLSFMALLVIPELKIGDKGLFDGNKFELCSLFV